MGEKFSPWNFPQGIPVALLLKKSRGPLIAIINEKIFLAKNGKKITIRVARESDAENFLNFSKSIMAEEKFSLLTPEELDLTVEQEQNWIKSHVENENHLILVAEIEGIIVGQLDFTNGRRKRIAHRGEFGINVHQDYRGQGIGSELLQTLLTWAKKHPLIEKVNLHVHGTNKRAISMYRKHGFQKEGFYLKDLKLWR